MNYRRDWTLVGMFVCAILVAVALTTLFFSAGIQRDRADRCEAELAESRKDGGT